MTPSRSGVVVIDKPSGPTSFAIVRAARRATGVAKVGHGGTLDPMASGVLPICLGEATKLAQFLLDADKEYEATISFGIETDTYDASGAVVARRAAGHLQRETVERALRGFVGRQDQLPPAYSALKRAGRPLYAYAREGKSVELRPRPIEVYALELHELTDTGGDGTPRASVSIRCSKGTYVRSLAHDVGHVVGTGAMLSGLRRTRSGPFGLERAIGPEALGAAPLPLISLSDALSHLARAILTEPPAIAALRQGKPVPWSAAAIDTAAGPATGPIRILAGDGGLVAVARRQPDDEVIRTLRVFGPA